MISTEFLGSIYNISKQDTAHQEEVIQLQMCYKQIDAIKYAFQIHSAYFNGMSLMF